MRIILVLFILVIGGCQTVQSGNPNGRPVLGFSEADIHKANDYCFSKFAAASREPDMQRWSKWAMCKKERVMQYDLAMYTLEPADIEALYDWRIARMVAYEKVVQNLSKEDGQKELDSIYAEYDERKVKIGMTTCSKWITTPGDKSGTTVCADRFKFSYNKDE